MLMSVVTIVIGIVVAFFVALAVGLAACLQFVWNRSLPSTAARRQQASEQTGTAPRRSSGISLPAEEPTNCPICLQQCDAPCKTNCGHTYCVGCISTWLSSNHNRTCALCRRRVTLLLPFQGVHYTPQQQRHLTQTNHTFSRIHRTLVEQVQDLPGLMAVITQSTTLSTSISVATRVSNPTALSANATCFGMLGQRPNKHAHILIIPHPPKSFSSMA
eukprot:m.81618 g.81618  ORF g.81618 m.81618 type:complete len:217 (-) comp12648_c0_seq2:244-894(-)